MKTRYRVLQNQITLIYKIQMQVFRFTIFGKHLKRKWIDYCLLGSHEVHFLTKEQAISKINGFKRLDIRERDQIHRRILLKESVKKDKFFNLWIKVYP
jgi:hypothetical protein